MRGIGLIFISTSLTCSFNSHWRLFASSFDFNVSPLRPKNDTSSRPSPEHERRRYQFAFDSLADVQSPLENRTTPPLELKNDTSPAHEDSLLCLCRLWYDVISEMKLIQVYPRNRIIGQRRLLSEAEEKYLMRKGPSANSMFPRSLAAAPVWNRTTKLLVHCTLLCAYDNSLV